MLRRARLASWLAGPKRRAFDSLSIASERVADVLRGDSFAQAQPFLQKMGARYIHCGASGNGLCVLPSILLSLRLTSLAHQGRQDLQQVRLVSSSLSVDLPNLLRCPSQPSARHLDDWYRVSLLFALGLVPKLTDSIRSEAMLLGKSLGLSSELLATVINTSVRPIVSLHPLKTDPEGAE